jgi:hypothetical protein
VQENVIEGNFVTTLDIPCERVLDGAKGKLETVLVVGFDGEGGLYLAASTSDKMKLHYLASLAAREIMDGE